MKHASTAAGPSNSALPAVQVTEAAPTAADPNHEPPLKTLHEFRFPVDTASDIDNLGDNSMLAQAGDIMDDVDRMTPIDHDTGTMDTNKTKASKWERVRKFQKRVVLKLREIATRIKVKMQNGGKKLKPKAPTPKAKVEVDESPAQAVDDAADLPVGQAFPAPAA